ncbi:MAG: hypothetical protein ACLFTW_10840 [Chitinispirillaceae bacterium]
MNRHSSILVLASFLTVFAHTAQDTALEITRYEDTWINDSAWYNVFKTVTGYDEQHREMFSTLLPAYTEPQSSTLWYYRSDYGFDFIEKVHIELDEFTGIWSSTSKEVIYEHPSVDSSTVQIRRFVETEWENSERTITVKNQNGLPSQKTYYSWDEQWVNDRREEYDYDSEGNLVIQIEQEWDSAASVWITRSREEYFYDNQGRKEEMHSYWSSGNSDELVPSDKTFYFYQNDKLVEEVRSRSRIVYHYDSRGNIAEEISQYMRSGEWENETRFRYEYAYYPGTSIAEERVANRTNSITLRQSDNRIVVSGFTRTEEPLRCLLFDLRGRLVYSAQFNGDLVIDKSRIRASGPLMVQIRGRKGRTVWSDKISILR